MQQRGLGASSMAGQALVQAALEASIPIAVGDANANMQVAQVRAAFLNQEFDQANQQIDKVLNISPGNYPASIIKSNVLSGQQKTIQAEEILRELLISKNNDPHLWMLLSEIQRAGKNIVGYHLSRGEYYLLLGDLENALNQFQLALGLSANSFQTSELIMTKIKFVQDRLGQKRGL
jgi:predicted Zn-dependent protease